MKHFLRKLFGFKMKPPIYTIDMDKVEPIKTVIPTEVINKKLDLSKIVVVDFPKEQYYSAIHTKKQIYLHHTVSGEGVKGDIRHWAKSKARVATCVIVDHDGVIHQAFSSKKWAHHLGIKSYIWKKFDMTNFNTKLNQQSIGIEIDSYGGLKKEDGVWKHNYGGIVPTENVIEYPEGFRGYYGFEKYTDKQIEAVRQLLVFWGKRYHIPLDYKGESMWDLNKGALGGEEGIWAHVSVRPDKSDIHPQKELIDMLKTL